MLISADCYYDLYLKGRNAEEVKAEICSMREQIENLKRKVESPYYDMEQHPYPSEHEMLAACRTYLKEARAVLTELGEDATSESDEKNAEFNRRLEFLTGISLELLGGARRYRAHRVGKEFSVECEEEGVGFSSLVPSEKIIGGVGALDAAEWRRHYLPSDYGCVEPFPKPWELRLDFSDGESVHFSGISIYPYNIGELLNLLSATPI